MTSKKEDRRIESERKELLKRKEFVEKKSDK